MSKSLSRLQTFYEHLDAEELLYAMIKEEFQNKIALVSSFGSGSALLLKMVSEIDNNARILFLDTEQHFQETIDYVKRLRDEFKLDGLKILKPNKTIENNIDQNKDLWQTQPNRCCWLRKVEPLNNEIVNGKYQALITGRKRYQTEERKEMRTIEMHDDGLFRINPLAFWDAEKVKSEFKKRNLPEHPLVENGFPSIGCKPCTREVKAGEDERAGRWAHTAKFPGNSQKVECGIHLSTEKPDWSV